MAQRPAPAKPEFIPPSIVDSDVQGWVRSEYARAERDQRVLIVYVGAAWCEPCQRFHHAVTEGKLDSELANYRFLDIDLDRVDRDKLGQAGYQSNLIPLFAVPNRDGSGSPRRIFGSIKGDGAVNEILPRLKSLTR